MTGGFKPFEDRRFDFAGDRFGQAREADTAMTNLINMQRQSQRNRSRYKTVKEEIRKSKFVFDVIHRVEGKIKNKQKELSLQIYFKQYILIYKKIN